MNKRKKRFILFISIAVYALILLVVSLFVLLKVKSLLEEYEASQPEKVVERQIELMKRAAKRGELYDKLVLPSSMSEVYDPSAPEFVDYIGLLSDSELTYKAAAGSSGSNGRAYYIMAGSTTVATLKLKSTNSRTELVVFNYSDWELDSISPVVYSADLELADGLKVEFGGKVITGSLLESGKIAYHIRSLTELKGLTVTDTFGNVMTLQNGAQPTVHSIDVELPKGMLLKISGNIVDGTTSESGNIKYSFSSLKELNITVEDEFGHTVKLADGVELVTRTFTATLPTSYTITVGEKTLSKDTLPVTLAEEYAYFKPFYEKYLADGAFDSAPGFVTYTFDCLMSDNIGEDIVITAPDGKRIPFDTEKGSISIDTLDVDNSPIPDSVSDRLDVKKFAETWALFMTRDLSGGDHGLSTVAKFLIRDSDLYKSASNWAYGIDITFISSHTLDNPTFTDEKFTNYREVGDNCFMCDVTLVQHMTLKSGQKHTEKLNMTICFVKYDQTDNGKDDPQWYVLAFRDIV